MGVDRLIAQLARRQDGILTRRQLLERGVSPDAIKRRLAARTLHPLHRGVYAAGHMALPDRARLRAAMIAAGPRAAASHRAAPFAYGLVPVLPATVDVTVAGGGGRSRPGLRVHRTTRPLPTRVVRGLRVVAPLVMLRSLGFEGALTREALARRLVRPEELPGGGPALTRSRLERLMERLAADAELPSPDVGHRIGPYTVDFAWPEHGVVVEIDSWGTHGSRDAFERDRIRDAYLAARGIVVIRITEHRLVDRPLAVAATVAAALTYADGSTRKARAA